MPFPRLLLKSDGTFRLIHPLFDGDHFKSDVSTVASEDPAAYSAYFLRSPYSAAAPLILFLFLSPPLL